MSGVLQNIDRYEVVFDDEGLVADATLMGPRCGGSDGAAGGPGGWSEPGS